MSTIASIDENKTHCAIKYHRRLSNLQPYDCSTELGKEGHYVAQHQFSGRSLAVFTSGGDAQGTKQ